MTLFQRLGVAGISTPWPFRYPQPVKMSISIDSSPIVADPHSTPFQHSECQHVHAHGDCKQQSNVWDYFPQTIRDWNELPESLISSSELPDDSVSKFTSLVRARD